MLMSSVGLREGQVGSFPETYNDSGEVSVNVGVGEE